MSALLMVPCLLCRKVSVSGHGALCSEHVEVWLDSGEGRRFQHWADHGTPNRGRCRVAFDDFVRRLLAEKLNAGKGVAP